MSYVATLPHLGNTFYLRSTVWTGERSRATVYATAEEALTAVNKAKPFMKAKQFRAVAIVGTHFDDENATDIPEGFATEEEANAHRAALRN